MFRCVFSGEESREGKCMCACTCGCVRVLRLYIYFLGSLGAGAPLVSGILSMYGIFLLSFLIRPGDWELIMA